MLAMTSTLARRKLAESAPANEFRRCSILLPSLLLLLISHATSAQTVFQDRFERIATHRFVAHNDSVDLSGPIADGSAIRLRSDAGLFGDKLTGHPSLYDLVDRGSWIQGQRRYPYDQATTGSEVPVGEDYVFTGRGGRPRFQTDDADPVATGRTRWYGGRFVDDGAGNITLRHPVGQFSEHDDWPPRPRVNHFMSWFWRSSFVPGHIDGDTGSSAKFIRSWDVSGGRDHGYRVSWTRMHLTASKPGAQPYPSWSRIEPPVNQWAQFEFDSYTVDNGHIRAWVNGHLHHDTHIPEVNPDWTGSIHVSQWGYDPSVDISTPGHRMEISDLYVDVSPARVLLTNAPSLEDATLRIPQMHLSWSADHIHLPDLYPGRLMSLDDAWLILITETRQERLLGQLKRI